MHPMLNTAIKAARRAGTIISRASLDLQHLSVARKGPKDYVTEVDRAAEEAIIEVLSEAYPDHGFIGEETGERPPLEPAGRRSQPLLPCRQPGAGSGGADAPGSAIPRAFPGACGPARNHQQ